MVFVANYEPPDQGSAIGIIFLCVFGSAFALIGIARIRELIWPKLLGNRMRRFFGRAALRNLKAHDKAFPGYDLGSVHRALVAFSKTGASRTP